MIDQALQVLLLDRQLGLAVAEAFAMGRVEAERGDLRTEEAAVVGCRWVGLLHCSRFKN